jgi:hypothetical protein
MKRIFSSAKAPARRAAGKVLTSRGQAKGVEVVHKDHVQQRQPSSGRSKAAPVAAMTADPDSGGGSSDSEPPPSIDSILSDVKVGKREGIQPYCSSAVVDQSDVDNAPEYVKALDYQPGQQAQAGDTAQPVPEYEANSAWQKMAAWMASGKYTLSLLLYTAEEATIESRKRRQEDGMFCEMSLVDRKIAQILDL